METEKLIATVIKARQGDRDALQALYLDAYMSIYRLALRMVKNPEDAEDITQEVYITVQQKIATLREPAAFYGWVNQITANKCYRLLSKYKSMARLDDEAEFIALADDDPLNLPDKALDNEASRKIIMEVIDNLPDGQRMCVLLYYYAQNTITQIADTLELNENTVKTRLSAARAKIRAALEYKAEKEGIKLWGIPLALTPILREAIENMAIPADAQARMEDFISRDTAESMNGNDSPGAEQAGSQQPGLKSLGANSAAKTVGKVILGMTAKKAVTAVLIVLLAGALITAGVIFLPKMINPSDPANTPGVSDTQTPGTTTPENTPGATDTTPDDTDEPSTTEPDNTPDVPKEPVVLLPDPENINEEELAKINGIFTMGNTNQAEVVAMVDNMLDEAYEKYGKYLNENISKLCVKIGLYSIIPFSESEAPITPEALEKVNDLLEANGEEPLELKEPEHKIAAIWLAASLYYDPVADMLPPQDFETFPGWRFDIAQAFALIKYSESEDIKSSIYLYASDYANLFNIPHPF